MGIINPLLIRKYSKSEFEYSERAKKFRDILINNSTNAEKRFIEILNSHKIDHIFQYIINVGQSFYITDFYLPKTKIAFEINGKNHYSKEEMRKDYVREKRIWEYSGIKIYKWSNKKVLRKSREIVKFLKRYIIPVPNLSQNMAKARCLS